MAKQRCPLCCGQPTEFLNPIFGTTVLPFCDQQCHSCGLPCALWEKVSINSEETNKRIVELEIVLTAAQARVTELDERVIALARRRRELWYEYMDAAKFCETKNKRIAELESTLSARETQATNQSRRIEELAELCEEKDKALADLKPGAEAWKLMREHHYSLNWDDGASPTFRGWEVCKSCDENGWLVKAVSDPVTAVLAAKWVVGKGGVRSRNRRASGEGSEGEAMNWKVSLPVGCADASEQQEAWAEIERLRAIVEFLTPGEINQAGVRRAWALNVCRICGGPFSLPWALAYGKEFAHPICVDHEAAEAAKAVKAAKEKS